MYNSSIVYIYTLHNAVFKNISPVNIHVHVIICNLVKMHLTSKEHNYGMKLTCN